MIVHFWFLRPRCSYPVLTCVLDCREGSRQFLCLEGISHAAVSTSSFCQSCSYAIIFFKNRRHKRSRPVDRPPSCQALPRKLLRRRRAFLAACHSFTTRIGQERERLRRNPRGAGLRRRWILRRSPTPIGRMVVHPSLVNQIRTVIR